MKNFKISSTYRAARKQQKTANRKSFYNDEGYMISPSEWADGVIADYLESEIGISRSVVEKVREDESEFKNLTLDVVAKIQNWIDDGNK